MTNTLLKHFLILLISFSITLMPALFCFSENVCGQELGYDFSDEAQAIFDATQEQHKKRENHKDTKIKPIKVKKNTDFDIALQTSINSANITKSDTVAACLEEDIIYKSNIIAPKGSIVYGKIEKVKSARGFYGNGFIKLSFDELMLPNGDVLNFSGNIIKIKMKGNRALKTGVDMFLGILGGAVVGMGILPITAPVTAAVGMLVGVVSAADTNGKDFEVPAGTAFTIRLIKPLKTVPYA